MVNGEGEILLEGKVIDFTDGVYPSVLYPESSKCQFTPLDVKIEGLCLSSYFFRISNPSRNRECWSDTGIVTVFEPILKDIVLFNPYWEVLIGEDEQCSDINTLISVNEPLLRAKVAAARLCGFLPDERHIDCQIRNGELLRPDDVLPEDSKYGLRF